MGWHDMDGWNWTWMTIVMVAFWLGIALLFWSLLRRDRDGASHGAEETLRQRMARGDIDIEEYERRLDALHHPRRGGPKPVT